MQEEHEEFDGSALRELLAPAVADRGRASAPTDAIVAAGRRRVVGRRGAIAGGALAIVAAVPLAATAIAAGPDKAATSAADKAGTAGTTTVTTTSGPAKQAPPVLPTPTPTPTSVPNKGSSTAPKVGSYGDPAGLPAKPTVVAGGTLEGRTWKITAEQAPGNNALTAGEKCLGLAITVDGRPDLINTAPALAYCLPVKNLGDDGQIWAEQYALQYYFTNGAGTLQMGTVASNVAKVVAHVDGLAPISVNTVPAPGLEQEAFYFIPVPKDDQGFRVSFDEYDAQGTKIGSFDNWTPSPFGAPTTTGAKH